MTPAGEPDRGGAPSGQGDLPRALAAGVVLLLVPASVALLATLMPTWSQARAAGIGWELPFGGPWFTLWAWALSALIGSVYAFTSGAGARRALGMALMWVPVVRTALRIVNDAAALASSGQVLPAYSEYQLSGFYIFSILRNLGYLGAGFILWSQWRPSHGLRDLAGRLRATGAAIVGRGEGQGVVLGFLLFPLLLVGTLGLDWFLGQAPQLVNSDESSIWDNMTPWHAVMISAAAAVGEEAVYRVFLMTALAVLLQRARLPARPAWATALVLQAVFFGFAHAGYANWLHVILAASFGLVAGIGALWLGVWVAIALHFLVDIYALGLHADVPFWIGFLIALLVTNAVATMVVAGRWAVARLRPTGPS